MRQFIVGDDSVQFKSSTNDIFKALISEAQWLSLTKASNKDLGALIGIIQNVAGNNESEGFKMPSINVLASISGLTSAKVTK